MKPSADTHRTHDHAGRWTLVGASLHAQLMRAWMRGRPLVTLGAVVGVQALALAIALGAQRLSPSFHFPEAIYSPLWSSR